jgi:ketosteroid isomerase-like protein
MRPMLCFAFVFAATTVLSACASSDAGRTGSTRANAAVHRAHDDFVAAINSNDLDAFLAMLTHDVVLMPPNGPRVVGEPAVRYWAQGYLTAFETHWVKTTLEFVVLGDWAFEQYAYESTDTPRDGGEILHDIGKGIIIYHREPDGVWRVARDAWNSDLPLTDAE